MTYCLGILLEQGLLLASDTSSNAGLDQIAKVNKLNLMPPAQDRLVAIQSAGNLATTQGVITRLREAFGGGTRRSTSKPVGQCLEWRGSSASSCARRSHMTAPS